MKFLTITTLYALATAATYDYPNEVNVSEVAYGGSGCGSDGESPNLRLMSADLLAVTYPRTLIARTGDTEPITAGRRNCQIGFQLLAPGKWEYAITSMYHGGKAELDASVSATAKAIVYFQGEVDQAESQLDLPASTDKFYLKKMSFDKLVWSGCGGAKNLNFNYQLRLTRGGNGVIETEDVPQFINMAWRKCQ